MAPSMDLEVFQGKETEYNWEKREASLRNLINILRDPETNVSELIKLIGFHYQDILLVLHTPRTQLSLQACNFVSALLGRLDRKTFDPLAEHTFAHLIKLCSSTKKIVAKSAWQVMMEAVGITNPHTLIAILGPYMREKNAAVRKCAMDGFLELAKNGSLAESWANMQEIIGKAVSDSNPEVRAAAIEIVERLQGSLGETTSSQFLSNLDLSAQKQIRLMLSKRASGNDKLQSADQLSSPLSKTPSKSTLSKAPSTPKILKETFATTPLKSSSDNLHVSEDDEIILPMQKIQITPDSQKSSGAAHLQTDPDDVPQSKIPTRSPSLLQFSSPYMRKLAKNNLIADNGPFSYTVGDVNELINQLSLVENLPATLQKLLILSASKYDWSSLQISATLVSLRQYGMNGPKAHIEMVGLIAKNLLGHLTNYNYDIDVIIEMLVSLWPFQFDLEQSWNGPITNWLKAEMINFDVVTASKICCQEGDYPPQIWISILTSYLNNSVLTSQEIQDEKMHGLVTDLVYLWNDCSDISLRRSVVECLSRIKAAMGETLFYQVAHDLTLPQKRVLIAFSAIEK